MDRLQCPHCRYDLAGLALDDAARCPECGGLVRLARMRGPWWSAHPGRFAVVTLGIGIIGWAVAWMSVVAFGPKLTMLVVPLVLAESVALIFLQLLEGRFRRLQGSGLIPRRRMVGLRAIALVCVPLGFAAGFIAWLTLYLLVNSGVFR